MRNPARLSLLVTALVLSLSLPVSPAAAQGQDEAAARKARILANMKMLFPQLEEMAITMGEITPTEFDGLDQGSFSTPGRPPQQFFVTKDDTQLYLISAGPIDVSKSEEQIQAQLAAREAEKAREAKALNKRLTEATEGLPARGNPDAPVTIVEFSDFQCPYCARGANTVQQILEKYPDDVKFVFKHYPLNFHNWARPAAIASHCAAQQSEKAFWALHDKYFEGQRALSTKNLIEKSKEYLAGVDIDMEQWTACADNTDSEAYKAAAAAVDADFALGKQLGVTGTPGFFVNGHFLKGARPLADFEPLIEKARGSDS